MCGIVGYIGNKPAYPVIIKGLQRLEYRGYDSAGVALLNHSLSVYKKKGKVSELASIKKAQSNRANVGMGHTRWATHGVPNQTNAHPHLSGSGEIALVHNGIIENYETLKNNLLKKGHKFLGQTDTEVLVHLIEEIKQSKKVSLTEAVRLALKQVEGTYAIVVISKLDPNTIVAAKKASPLAIGVGKDEFVIASDATPIVEYTKRIVYLQDEQIATLNGKLEIRDLNNKVIPVRTQTVSLEVDQLEKGGFDHFMLKEIFEQPTSIKNSMRGRIQKSQIVMDEVKPALKKILKAKRIIMVACGTSWHSGLIAEHLFEDLAKIPTEVEYASEFRYRRPIITKDDVVIAISQSGETADTLAAIELAHKNKALVIGVCNVVGSSIARNSDVCIYTHAGPEISVASTKAFTCQTSVLIQLALLLAQNKKTLNKAQIKKLIQDLQTVPSKVEKILSQNAFYKKIALKYKTSDHALYLGRDYNFPVALEGAIKLKEISYVHAEGYPAAEMKHGPIALIDDQMPVVFIATNGNLYEKTVSNIQEVKARAGRIIALVTKGDKQVSDLAEDVIEIPETHEAIAPLLSTIPLQLIAYHTAVARGCNVDQPRNLAKSVTVE